MTTTLTPYLSFDGTTREAYAFYEQALGARILTMMRYGDMPKMEGESSECACTPASSFPAARCCSPATCRRT
jgi:PhnB protein